MSRLALLLKHEARLAVDRLLQADVDSLRAFRQNDARAHEACDERLLDERAVFVELRRAHTGEVVEGTGLLKLQLSIDAAKRCGNDGIAARLEEARDRILRDRQFPRTGETRRGSNPAMNDAYVDSYDPNVSPPWFVRWPKGDELGSGGWYDTESILAFWPEVVKDS